MMTVKRLLLLAVAVMLFSTSIGCCRKNLLRKDSESDYCKEPCDR